MLCQQNRPFLCDNEREICLQTLHVDMKKARDNMSKNTKSECHYDENGVNLCQQSKRIVSLVIYSITEEVYWQTLYRQQAAAAAAKLKQNHLSCGNCGIFNSSDMILK